MTDLSCVLCKWQTSPVCCVNDRPLLCVEARLSQEFWSELMCWRILLAGCLWIVDSLNNYSVRMSPWALGGSLIFINTNSLEDDLALRSLKGYYNTSPWQQVRCLLVLISVCSALRMWLALHDPTGLCSYTYCGQTTHSNYTRKHKPSRLE